MTKFLKYALMLALLIGFASCGKKDDTPATPEITLDKEIVLIKPAGTATVTATVTPASMQEQLEWVSGNEEIATVDNGTITGVALSNDPVTIYASLKGTDVRASCKVYVVANPIDGIVLSKSSIEISENEVADITASALPEGADNIVFDWASDNQDIATVTPAGTDGSKCRIAAKGAGKTTVTAFTFDGLISASCEVTVKKWVAPTVEPKVGDYFYSDGTWSDGGLVSIDADGTNPVWAETKPAPISGKTVIGIVFQTNPDRIADTEKNNGFTHGYVVATKKAHNSQKTTTSYSLDGEFSVLNAVKSASTWYKDIGGWDDTQKVISAYAGNMQNVPLFDWVTTDFSPSAPGNTSGWFVPATGQVWDMLANLGGGEVATYLASCQTETYDATYYVEKNDISYSVIDALNEKMALVPADQKEEFKIENGNYWKSCSIWTSSYYGDATADIFRIGIGGATTGGRAPEGIAASCENMDGDAYACPILAF